MVGYPSLALATQFQINATGTDVTKSGNRVITTDWTLVFDDTSSDGLVQVDDNCPTVENAYQVDSNGDGFGDACVDPSLTIPSNADVHPTTTVGANTTINKNVSVGDDSNIGKNNFITSMLPVLTVLGGVKGAAPDPASCP